jgi:hypothetical protein
VRWITQAWSAKTLVTNMDTEINRALVMMCQIIPGPCEDR